jgi:hypothetical protein
MPLRKQLYSVPFSSGIDTKTDERLVAEGNLLELENGVFTKGGSIKKRTGYTTLTREKNDATQISSGTYLTSHNNELLLFDNTNMYSWDETADKWVDKGLIPSLNVSSSKIIRNDSSSQTLADVAYCNGYIVYVWQDTRSTNSIRYSVLDNNTGNFIISDSSVATSRTQPKVVTVNDKVMIFYLNGTTILFKVFSSTIPTSLSAEFTVSTITAITSFSTSDSVYDVCAYDNTSAVIAGNFIARITPSNTFETALVGTAADEGLAVASDGTFIYLFISTTSPSIDIDKLDSTLSVVASGDLYSNGFTGQHRAAIGIDSTNSRIYAFGQLAFSSSALEIASFNTSLTSYVFGGNIGKSFLAHQPYLYNGKLYFGVWHSSTLQSSYFLYVKDTTTTNVLVTKINQNNGNVFTSSHHVSRIINPSSGIFTWPSIIRNRVTSNNNTFFFTTGVNAVTYNMSPNVKFSTAAIGGDLLISSGMLYDYDGAGLTEHGFHLFPEGVTGANAGAGSVADGTYLYKAVYEWTDNNGNRQRSAPSPSLSHTVTGGPRAVTITIPSIVHTRKKSPRQDISIIVYRTAAGGSTVFYRLSSLTAPTANNSAGTAATYSDTAADASITSNEILYTVGGEVENIGPPANSLVVTGGNRAFIAGLENGNEFWFSKEYITNEGVGFSDFLIKRVDPLGGNITAMAYMDGKLILFKENRILFMSGEGPLATAQQDTFTTPQLITADVGCTNQNSVVVMEKGVMFQSAKGIYLLNRSLATEYIGAPVESFNTLTVTSSVVLPDDNEVRFTSSNGTVLTYNYFFNQWSTFTNHQAVGSTIWQDLFCWLRSNGITYKESTSFTDDTTPVQLRLTTAWIKAQQIQGFKRIWRMALLGEFRSTHSFKVKIAYDYNPAYVEEFTLTTDGMGITFYGDSSPYGDEAVYGGVADSVFQLRSRLARQKCESIKFEFSDILGTSTGESFLLNELALEVGYKGGLMKLSSAKTGGV